MKFVNCLIITRRVHVLCVNTLPYHSKLISCIWKLYLLFGKPVLSLLDQDKKMYNVNILYPLCGVQLKTWIEELNLYVVNWIDTSWIELIRRGLNWYALDWIDLLRPEFKFYLLDWIGIRPELNWYLLTWIATYIYTLLTDCCYIRIVCCVCVLMNCLIQSVILST